MKNKKIVVFLIITSIILIGIICSFIIGKRNVIKEKQVIKEMSESTQVSDLQNQINQLNTSQEEYVRNVQSYKTKIATAITSQKVTTSENATIDEMVTNIGKILQARTKDATATADNITKGKTAYINGKLITGNGADNNSYYENGCMDGINKGGIYYLGTATSFNIKELLPNIDYTSLTNDNFIAQIDKSYQYIQASYISGTSYNTVPSASIQGSEFNYDASTGILNFSGYTLNSSIANSAIGYYSGNKEVISHVYLIIGEIIDATI